MLLKHIQKNKNNLAKMTKDKSTVWEVFIQSKNGLAHKHFGNVHAEDKEMALQNARDLYTRRNEGSCIWVVRSSKSLILLIQISNELSFSFLFL